MPSNTQSVETSTTCAPASLAASTTLRVAPTYASQASRRRAASSVRSLRIAQWTIASGAKSATRARHGDGVRDVDLGARGRGDLVAVVGEDVHEVGADEAAAAGKPNPHAGTPFTVWSKSITEPVTILAASHSR